MSDWLLISDWLVEFWSTNCLLINSDWLIDYWLINVSSDRPIEFWLINWFLIDQLIADCRGICECKSAVEATLLNTAANLGL